MNNDTAPSRVRAQGDREIVIAERVDAPRDMLFDGLVKPELLVRWLFGSEGWLLAVCKINAEPGGDFYFVWRRAYDGAERSASGVFLKVAPPARLVAVVRFDAPWPAGEVLSTIDLVEHDDGAVALTLTLRAESRAARDGVLVSPIVKGLTESCGRLEELLTATVASDGRSSRRGADGWWPA